MRKKELTICSNPDCGVEFLKDKSEINRNKKIGRQNYCSLKCSGANNHKHLGNYVKDNVKFVLPHTNNRRDEFTGLREHFRRVKKRKHEYNIDLNDLLDQWETQKGICVYSGVKLVHPNDGGDYINTASLDRVDSKLGLTGKKVNIHFKNGTLHIEWAKDKHIIMTGSVSNIKNISLKI